MGMPCRPGSRLASRLTTFLPGDTCWLSLPAAELGALWALQLMPPSAPGVVPATLPTLTDSGLTTGRIAPDPW
jgi:hypothetical protein